MNCPNCGTINQNGETFCNNCGQRLSGSGEVTNNKKKPSVILSIIIAVLAVFLWIFIFSIISFIFNHGGTGEVGHIISRGIIPLLMIPGGFVFGVIVFVISYNKQK